MTTIYLTSEHFLTTSFIDQNYFYQKFHFKKLTLKIVTSSSSSSIMNPNEYYSEDVGLSDLELLKSIKFEDQSV